MSPWVGSDGEDSERPISFAFNSISPIKCNKIENVTDDILIY